MIQANWLMARATFSAPAFTSDMQLGVLLFNGGQSFRLAFGSNLGQIFVGYAEPSGLHVDAGRDAISVSFLACRQIGLKAELDRLLSNQGRNAAGRHSEGFKAVSSYGPLTSESLIQSGSIAYPGQSVNGFYQRALAGGIGPEQNGQLRQFNRDVMQRLEVADNQFLEHGLGTLMNRRAKQARDRSRPKKATLGCIG